MRFLQINVNRSRAATDLAWATVMEQGVQFILASEPNKATLKGTGGTRIKRWMQLLDM